ncbi:MAG TPA: addiction module protein [Gemmataceae bacterium]|jgi:putative addiction module component (TIGR02574 family)
MSETAESILAAALTLPDAEREALVERLIESLPHEDVDEMTDDELEAELDRRAAEYAQDPSVAIPWTEFRWDDPS